MTTRRQFCDSRDATQIFVRSWTYYVLSCHYKSNTLLEFFIIRHTLHILPENEYPAFKNRKFDISAMYKARVRLSMVVFLLETVDIYRQRALSGIVGSIIQLHRQEARNNCVLCVLCSRPRQACSK